MSFEKMMNAVTEILKHKDFYQDPVSRLREAYKKGFNDCHLDQFDGFKSNKQELAALREWKEKARPILQCVVWDTEDVTRFTIGNKNRLANQLLEEDV